MADTGWKSPSTVVSDDTVGTVAWSNPDNAKTSNNSYAVASEIGELENPYDKVVKLVDETGTVVGSNYAETDVGDIWSTSADGTVTYGGNTDLWGSTWSATDLNDSDFGLVLQATASFGDSEYLKVTNFGFSIPSDSTINGIEVKIEKRGEIGMTLDAKVDNIQIKVYYTESSGTEADSERGLYLSGKVAESSERGLYLQGEITTDSERGLYLEGYASDLFTRESASDLESDDANLTTAFSEQEYTDVATDDDDFVDLEGGGAYQKFLFKRYNENSNNTDNFIITWKGKTTLAPSGSSVYLQIYNRDTTSWETIDTESSANANTEFTLSGIKTTSLSDYYDEDYVVNCRVYQEIV